MKFSCTQENLNRGLALVNHVANKNANLPILANVLIEADKSGLKLSTTNLEVGITSSIRGKTAEPGKITIPARLLSDYVNLLPNERIDFVAKDNELQISGQKSQTKIKGLSAEEFPVIPQVEKGEVFKVKARDFKNAVSAVSFAVAYDESRPEISGVYTILQKDQAILVATDSYRLAEKQVGLAEASKKEEKVIVPVRTYQELSRILEEENEELTIAINESQIQFTVKENQLVSRVIDGQYPDYRQIIPGEQKTKIKAEVNELSKAIKTASLFCKSGINDINLQFSDGAIKIFTANSQVGESQTKIDAKIEGEPNQIVFNYRYLLDGLANLNSEEVEIAIIDNGNPGVLRPVGEQNYLYIIMPIKQ